MLAHLIYITVTIGLALSIPVGVLTANGGLVLTLGFIGLWRYSWAAVNYCRAVYYIRVAYPRRRADAEAVYDARPRKAHAYFLVTSYKIESATTARVYRAAFEAAIRSRGGATLVASVVDVADERLIRALFERYRSAHPTVRLIIDRVAGTGKRDALATSLATIAAHHPTRDDVVLLIDGDTCVPADIVARGVPFFTSSAVGALTTDERSETTGSELFRNWFALRFTQRQMMMSAVALGRRVLTLTGRLSMFRADLATDPEFVATIRHDFIDHWRLGRVNFLTGDDKSTWFWLLKQGYQMVYLPDVQCVAMESQPREGFVESATTLMIRWFGNMLRTNGRALGLGPSRVGFFTWWSILDQRISMWTTLTGPAAAIIASLLVDPLILPAYISWVMATRYVNCLVLRTFRPAFPISYPFLLYFGQITGALVKSYVLFRLDRQRWTRQSTAIGSLAGFRERFRRFTAVYMHVLAIGWFLVGLTSLTSLVSTPLN